MTRNGDCVTAVPDNSLGGGVGEYMVISVLDPRETALP